MKNAALFFIIGLGVADSHMRPRTLATSSTARRKRPLLI